MAISQTTIRTALDSAALDSLTDSNGHTALELLQVIDAAKTFYRNTLTFQNFSFYNYYDSSGDLPSYIDSEGYLVETPDSSLEGLLTVTSNLTERENSLWLHTGDRWRELINLDSAISLNTQGNVYAYTTGGTDFPGTRTNDIDRWPFASEGVATRVGSLTSALDYSTGTQSKTNSYNAGGNDGSIVSTIQKFPFSNDAASTLVDELLEVRQKGSGQSAEFFGYMSGGEPVPSPTNNPFEPNYVQKYSFVNDEKASFVQYLDVNVSTPAGVTSTLNGYAIGGIGGGPGPSGGGSNVIQRFSFSNDEGDIISIGNLTISGDGAAGLSSTTKGYVASRRGYGPGTPPFMNNVIDEFPFASESTVTDIGDQFIAKVWSAGHSYDDQFGYTSGGTNIGQAALIVVDKFPFTSPFATSVQAGDLSTAKVGVAGTQF